MAFEGERQDPEEVWGRGFALRANRSAVSLLKTREIQHGGRTSIKNQFHLSFLLSVWVVEST